MRRSLALWALAFASAPAAVRAELTTFTVPMVADYEFSILGGTPLNSGATTPFLPFRAVGPFTFVLDPSINDPTKTTVPFTNATAVLQGTPPSPPNTLPHTISPNVQFLGGSLTNIVRDAGGEVVSANVSNLSMEWELLGQSPSFPVRIYSRGGLPFSGTGLTIPFSLGSVLGEAAEFNGYLDDGDGNPANDLLVVIGRNRTLTVVPEPASAVLMGLGALGLGVATLRRRSRGRHDEQLGLTIRL